MIGTIRNIRDDKDYAFIVCGANRDIFLHKRAFLGKWDDLREFWRRGTVTVEFEPEETAKGLAATKCKVVDSNNILPKQ
jgi:cold shock CspA family protein